MHKDQKYFIFNLTIYMILIYDLIKKGNNKIYPESEFLL